MSRRKQISKWEILPDPKFGDATLAKFINTVMKSGKKSIAENIVYGALDMITEKKGRDGIEVFNEYPADNIYFVRELFLKSV